MYKLLYSDQALEALENMPSKYSVLIRSKLRLLAEAPLRPNNNVKKLVGQGAYRLRIGNWRAIYSIEHGVMVIHVITIGLRKDVYD